MQAAALPWTATANPQADVATQSVLAVLLPQHPVLRESLATSLVSGRAVALQEQLQHLQQLAFHDQAMLWELLALYSAAVSSLWGSWGVQAPHSRWSRLNAYTACCCQEVSSCECLHDSTVLQCIGSLITAA